jgi:hypothetical protein
MSLRESACASTQSNHRSVAVRRSCKNEIVRID